MIGSSERWCEPDLCASTTAVAQVSVVGLGALGLLGCGYKLANDGHDTRAIQVYLGHRNIQNTTRYTAPAPQRFKEFFEIDDAA